MTGIFGQSPDGNNVLSCTLRNGGTVATVLSWGATLQDFRIAGISHPLNLGGCDMSAYLGSMQYFGAIVGPVANRIAGARFVIGGQTHQLERNENGQTSLHSGPSGFSQRNWTFDEIGPAMCRLVMNHPDNLGGFPGPIRVSTTYRLDETGALDIEITGESEKPVFFSPAFHGYWNLSGSEDLSDHELLVAADRYLPVDEDQIPKGPPENVAESPFDYRDFRPIGPLFDHNFCLSPQHGEMQLACTVKAGGLALDVTTDQPGVQVYNGQHIDTGATRGLQAKPYGKMSGLAIEPQFWPDTPNRPDYPSSLLLPGQVARHRSRFAIRRDG